MLSLLHVRDNLPLIYAACKFIDLATIVPFELINLNEWIFYDCPTTKPITELNMEIREPDRNPIERDSPVSELGKIARSFEHQFSLVGNEKSLGVVFVPILIKLFPTKPLPYPNRTPSALCLCVVLCAVRAVRV